MNIDDFIKGIESIYVKEYLQDAINAYNAGSYRASITYTWLSVFMDIYQKIEQLSITGEQEAINIVNKIDKIRKENNIPEMLKLERNILNVAKDKFNLIDDIAFIDLQRIQEDRNRCVHPLLSYDGALYQPTPEQARTHLINAYNKLLNEPNVYGKAVIDRLFELIYSSLFPFDYEKAKIVLDSGYLKSPKESLLRNFTISLLKQNITENLDVKKLFGVRNTIKYLLGKYRGKIESIIADKLPVIIDFTKNDEMLRLMNLFCVDRFFYDFFDDAKKILIKGFIDNMPTGNVELLAELLFIDDISSNVKVRINQTERKELYDIVPFGVPKVIRKLIIKCYITSGEFNVANSFAAVVINTISEMERDEIIELINGIATNSQVSYSFQVGTVLRKIQSSKIITEGEFLKLINDNNLGDKLENP
jgi:hypothetical protein